MHIAIPHAERCGVSMATWETYIATLLVSKLGLCSVKSLSMQPFFPPYTCGVVHKDKPVASQEKDSDINAQHSIVVCTLHYHESRN